MPRQLRPSFYARTAIQSCNARESPGHVILLGGKRASLQLIAYRGCCDKQCLPIRSTITVHVYVAPNLNDLGDLGGSRPSGYWEVCLSQEDFAYKKMRL